MRPGQISPGNLSGCTSTAMTCRGFNEARADQPGKFRAGFIIIGEAAGLQ